MTKCETDDEYRQQLSELKEWNESAGYWLGIDPGLGSEMRAKFVELGLEGYLH